MGRVYKRKDLKPLPAGATFEEKNGKRYASWTVRKKHFRCPLAACGTKYVREAPKWSVEYTPACGGPSIREQTPYTDKGRAEHYLRKLEQEEADKRNGVFDESQQALQQAKSEAIDVHVDAYVRYLQGKGDTDHHVQTIQTRIRQIFVHGNIDSLAQLRLSTVQEGLAKATSGGADQTKVHFTRAVKSFVAWLIDDGRLADDPIRKLKPPKVVKVTRVRRVLSYQELEHLLAATQARSRPNQNIPGPDRAVMWLLLACTGFRKREMGSVTPEHFYDCGGELTLLLEAPNAKNRRQARMPVPTKQAVSLRQWLATKPAGEKLFRVPDNLVKLLKRDLAAAREAWLAGAASAEERQAREALDFLKYRNAAGEVADVHSLRAVHATLTQHTDAPAHAKLKASRHSNLDVARRYHKAADREIASVQHQVGEMLPAWIGRPNSEDGRGSAGQCASQCANPEAYAGSTRHLEAHKQPADQRNSSGNPQFPENAEGPKSGPEGFPNHRPFSFEKGPRLALLACTGPFLFSRLSEDLVGPRIREGVPLPRRRAMGADPKNGSWPLRKSLYGRDGGWFTEFSHNPHPILAPGSFTTHRSFPYSVPMVVDGERKSPLQQWRSWMDALNGFGGTGVSRLEAVREAVGMKRWMRQAARKHSKVKSVSNDTAKAAADALAQLMKDARKHA